MRRVSYFALGRPDSLIRDLVGDPYGQISFYAGDLAQRLLSANLASIDPRHARSIGVAVGQLAARHTFNVRIEGVDAAIDDVDLARWPGSYRIGVANALLFGPAEVPSIDVDNVHSALRILIPAANESAETTTLLERVMATTAPGRLGGDPKLRSDLLWFVEQNTDNRPTSEEAAAWRVFASYLRSSHPQT